MQQVIQRFVKETEIEKEYLIDILNELRFAKNQA
jgi:hypothetical protein